MLQNISPTTTVALLVTGVVLLLYGVRLITDTVQRATDARVQQLLRRLARRRLVAFGVGIFSTMLMQSSSAMSSLLVGLVSADLLPLATAILMVLGANIGSTLVVQLLALHITDYALEFVGLGAMVALFTYHTPYRTLGQALFAFGLIVLGLFTLAQGSLPLATSPLTAQLLRALVDAPVVLVLIGAALAMLLNSSAASIGLVLTLTANHALPPVAALALMLGANVGTTLSALLTSLNEGTLSGRRLALVHTGTKLARAVVLFVLLVPLAAFLAALWPSPGTQVAMAHLGFNLALALVFGPLAAPLARLMEYVLPEQKVKGTPTGPRFLDASVLTRPAIALGQATRETLHMAEVVSDMLEHSLDAFEDAGVDIQASMEALDDQVDELYVAIKGYLTQLDEGQMTEGQVYHELALLYLVTDLEAIGDVVVKRFMSLARRQRRKQLLFSEEGRTDLLSYHQQVVECLQQVLAALATHDPALAEEVVERQTGLASRKRDLQLRHLRRLREGIPESVASSATHLDLLDALQTTLAHITSMAQTLAGDRGHGVQQSVMYGQNARADDATAEETADPPLLANQQGLGESNKVQPSLDLFQAALVESRL